MGRAAKIESLIQRLRACKHGNYPDGTTTLFIEVLMFLLEQAKTAPANGDDC